MEENLFEDYMERLEDHEKEELQSSSVLIEDFIKLAAEKGIHLTKDNFSYSYTIGITAVYPNILLLLNGNISIDKEGLFDFRELESQFKRIPFSYGYFKTKEFIIMANSFFRRSNYEHNNFAPRFIELFWQYSSPQNDKYISLDTDRVRIDVNDNSYRELDTWYGAKFKRNVSDIDDGIVKLRPPLDLDARYIDTLFGDIYSLDIKWASKDGVKVFQLEEFKAEDKRITKDGKEYHPVKYVHAEFDITNGCFRHFDGAIHFYTTEEYYQRRDSDFNYNDKNSMKLKTLSQKLFKVNGQITVDDWVLLCSHYLTGNVLIIEYFEGKLPDRVTEIIERIRAKDK